MWRVVTGLVVILMSGAGCVGRTLTAERKSSGAQPVASFRTPRLPRGELPLDSVHRLAESPTDDDLFTMAVTESKHSPERTTLSRRRVRDQHSSSLRQFFSSLTTNVASQAVPMSDDSWRATQSSSLATQTSWRATQTAFSWRIPTHRDPTLFPSRPQFNSELNPDTLRRAQSPDSVFGLERDPLFSGRRGTNPRPDVVTPRESDAGFSTPTGFSRVDPFVERASFADSTDSTDSTEAPPLTSGSDDSFAYIVAEPRKGILHDLFAPEPLDDLGPILGSPIGHRWRRIVRDYRYMYLNSDMWVDYGFALGIAAIFANTDLDMSIQEFHREQVRNEFTDRISDPFTFLGEGQYLLPIYGGVLLFTNTFPNLPLSPETHEWSARTLRGMLTGAPLLVFTQDALGPARPDAAWNHSRWDLFGGGNVGASGHAFMSAVPFLAAAEMTEDPLLRSSFLALSMMGGFARFNDDRHYASQVFLGWWIAYLSTRTTSITQGAPSYRLAPIPLNGGNMGIGFERRF
jgi:hypothetical protein